MFLGAGECSGVGEEVQIEKADVVGVVPLDKVF